MRPAGTTPGRRARRTVGATACLALAVGLLAGGRAVAGDEPAPSADQVRAAQDAATARAADVGRLRARLAEADQRVEDLAARAARAGEAANGARYRLEQTRSEARRTAERATLARRATEAQRQVVARLTVADVQSGTSARRFGALLSVDGTQRMLEREGAFTSAGEATTAALASYESARAVSQTYARRSRAAVTAQRRLTARAARAEQDARAAVAASEQAASGLRTQKAGLVRQLARAEGVSYALATRRQAALERVAAERAASVPGRSPAAAAPAEPAEPAQDPAPAEDRDPDRDRAPADPAPDPRPEPEPEPEPRPEPEPEPEPEPDPRPSGGVEDAIAFARAQLGEPYVWGADGPGSWDCSGLTMRAWAAGGVQLPHFSGGQYEASRPIPVDRARRGDLLFWSDGGPGSIYHVALSLGDGRMIHAPRPGKGVEIVSIDSWIAPDLAARVR